MFPRRRYNECALLFLLGSYFPIYLPDSNMPRTYTVRQNSGHT